MPLRVHLQERAGEGMCCAQFGKKAFEAATLHIHRSSNTVAVGKHSVLCLGRLLDRVVRSRDLIQHPSSFVTRGDVELPLRPADGDFMLTVTTAVNLAPKTKE